MPDFTSTLLTPRLSAAPTSPSPTVGQMYYDTALNQLRYWNGTVWTNTGGSASDPLKVDKDSVVVAATRIVASKLLAGDAQPAFQITGDGRMAWGAGGSSAPDTWLQRVAVNNLWADGVFTASGVIYANQSAAAGNQMWLGRNMSTIPSAGITFGSDTPFYRSAPGVLQMDGGLKVYGGINTDMGSAGAKILWGAANDTNLYRLSANALKTDGSLTVARGVNIGDSTNQGWAVQALNADVATRPFLTAAVTGDSVPRFFITAAGSVSWGPGNAASDTNLYRSAAGQLRTGGQLVVDGPIYARQSLFVDYSNSGYQLYFGSAADTNLYRAGAAQLKTDGYFYATQSIYANQGGANQVGLVAVSGLYPGVVFGSAGDTNLYRSAAGTLKTDGVFDAVSYALGGQMAWYKPAAGYMRSGDYVTQIMRTAFGQALGVGLTTDTTEHLRIDTNGMLSWGPGNAANDTNLYRSAAGTLKTDGRLHALEFWLYPGSANLLQFIGSLGAAKGGSLGSFKVTIDGTDRWVPYFA